MKIKIFIICFAFSVKFNGQTSGNGLTDIDGNFYPSVIIGNQEWMTTNLRTTKFNDGQSIQYQAVGIADNTDPTNPRYFKAGNNDDNISEKGLLYNFFTISSANFVPNPQDGWHIPTQAEWQELNNFISDVPQLTKINGSLLWTYTPISTNQYNFSLLPTGGVSFTLFNSLYGFGNGGTSAQYWTNVNWSTSNGVAIQYVCNPNIIVFQPSTAEKRQGKSIRLVRSANLSNEYFQKSKIKIYPNPLKNVINIIGDEVIYKIEIFDLSGKNVFYEENPSKTINLEFLEKGIYICKIESENGNYTNKIIKE